MDVQGGSTRQTLRSSPLARLRAAVPDLWEDLGPMCRTVDRDSADALGAELRHYLADHATHAEHARELGNELLALLPGWVHFSPEQRAVLVGAMTYLVTSSDMSDDLAPGGLDDDDRVVAACVHVLLRPVASVA